ncbi:MAG: tetratricopeptide repeat-containing sulfotransferase family protein [Luteimonas sp.]
MTAANPRADDHVRWQHAESLVAADRLDEAVEAYRSLRDSEELVVPASLRLSQIAARRGQLRESVACALNAYQLRRPEPELLCSVARVLGPLGELRAMFACAHDFSVMRGGNPEVLLEFGTLLSAAGFPEDALQMLQRARNAGIRGPQLSLPVARTLQALGRTADARSAYGACLEAAPSLVAAWLGLAEIGGRSPAAEAALAQVLIELLEKGGETVAAAAPMHYALFQMLDRGSDAEAAWAALDRGMDLQRSTLAGYDPALDLAVLEHVGAPRADDAGGAEPDADADAARAGATAANAQGPAPVFLVGLHGPALAAFGALLARHPQVGDLGEARTFVQQLRWCADAMGPPRLDLDLARRADTVDPVVLGQRYLAYTGWRAPGKAVALDRNPANFASVAQIAKALPHTRILHLAAGPMDTCFSAMSSWTDGEAPWSHDQAETADYYRAYRRLMAHWRSQFPERVLDVRQDELLADPAAVLDEVLRFCGLDASVAPQLAEGAASLVGEGRAAPQRWKRYEKHLAPLKAGLGALAY